MSENDDGIYIDCQPVNDLGEVETDEKTTSSSNNNIIDSMATDFSLGNVSDNPGFQIVLGIALFGIIYTVGDYVFRILPKDLLNKKLNK
jgi:hypothetical protein